MQKIADEEEAKFQAGIFHVETCHEGGKSTTYDGSKDAEHKIAAVFARRTATGSIELYTPAIFQSAQRDMKLSFQKAMDSIQTK